MTNVEISRLQQTKECSSLLFHSKTHPQKPNGEVSKYEWDTCLMDKEQYNWFKNWVKSFLQTGHCHMNTEWNDHSHIVGIWLTHKAILIVTKAVKSDTIVARTCIYSRNK